MSETLAPPAAAIATTHRGLASRAIGVITSPGATYADVVSRPRAVGALLVIVALIAAGSLVFFNTQVGQDALLDQQIRMVEAFGGQVNDAMYDILERRAPYSAYFTAGSQIVFLPLSMLAVAGIGFVIFNAIGGGDATFKQLFTVVVHSGFVLTLAQFFVLPLNYARESISSPTNLAVFLPFLDENTFGARLLGAIDLFYLWWMVNLSIGFGVLYKRRTGPIIVGMLIAYVVIAVAVAAIRSALSGA